MAATKRRPGATGGGGRHVALLRGINVGGKRSLPMKDLVAVFTALGCRDVVTYIQSGNVVFGADERLARKVPQLAAAAIAEQHGLDVPVILRSARELRDAVDADPFASSRLDPKLRHVYFLADAPPPARVAALDPSRSPPDEFRVRGREVYLLCPNGMARTKLTNAYFDSVLGTVSTARNLRTVTELLALAEG